MSAAAGAGDALSAGLSRYLTRRQLASLAAVRIGVAGAGGIGSNVAFMLARSGLRRFLLLDFDEVEPSNLNRQCFLPSDVGRPKAEALRDGILALSPGAQVDARVLRVTGDVLPGLLPLADIWIEAFDGADDKRVLVEACLAGRIPVVSASGIAGWGGAPMRRRDVGTLTVVGDFERDVADYPPLAPRVVQAAAMMADAVLERILGTCGEA